MRKERSFTEAWRTHQIDPRAEFSAPVWTGCYPTQSGIPGSSRQRRRKRGSMIRRGSRRVEIEDETEVGGQRLPLEIKTNAALDAGGGRCSSFTPAWRARFEIAKCDRDHSGVSQITAARAKL